MEKTVKLWCIIYIFAALTIVNGARIQTNPHLKDPPAPAPSADCSEIIYDMEDCLSFLVDGESEPKPSPTCCSGFAEVVSVDGCVCEGLKGAANMGISINLTKAATLPTLCHVSAPPISSCNLSNTPVPSPGGPSPAPPTTNPPTTTPPTTNPPSSSPTPATPTNPPATPPPSAANPPSSSPPPTTPTNPPSSPPPSTPDTPPTSSTPPTSGTTPSAPATSPSSNAPEANSPSSPIHSKSAGTSTMPVFLVSSVMVVASFLG